MKLPLPEKRELESACRHYGVARLEIFGSATRADFEVNGSDVDLIVRFADEQSPGLFDRYWGFTEALEKIFRRPIDLLTERMIRNPYLRAAIDGERETLYAAEGEKVLG